MTEYCLLALSLIIIEGFRGNKAYMGNSTLQTLHSESKFWILLLSNFLFKTCTSIHHMVHNYQQKRNSDFSLKSCQYFCFKN